MKTEILYEDGDVLVVYKPAGFAVQSAKAGQLDVVSELKNYLQQCGRQRRYSRAMAENVPYLGVVHRLDQPVEGVLVFAKNKRTAASLSEQLKKQGDEGTFHKQYYAVICGRPSATEGKLVDFLFKNKKNKAEVAAEHEVPGAKRAVLKYLVMETQCIKILAAAERSQTIENVRTAERSQTIENVRTAERSQTIENARAAERSQTIENARATKRSQTIENARSAESGQTIENAWTAKTGQMIENTGIAERGPTLENARTAERGQTIGNVQDEEKVQSKEGMGQAAGGKNSVSAEDKAGVCQGEPAQVTLADIHIQTGRFHQIRVQMAHAGMPLLGDLKYGNEYSKALSQELKIQNVALCAYGLTFLHPVSNKEMHFQIKPKGKAFSRFSQE